MTYTQLALLGVVVTVVLDLYVLRTRLLTRKVFWVSYAIVVFFQLLSNGVLTGTRTVQYSGDAIVGSSSIGSSTMGELAGPPALFGDGRIFYAPFEDLLFGFALVVQALAWWVFWGRRGVQREPRSGPPLWVRGR